MTIIIITIQTFFASLNLVRIPAAYVFVYAWKRTAKEKFNKKLLLLFFWTLRDNPTIFFFACEQFLLFCVCLVGYEN